MPACARCWWSSSAASAPADAGWWTAATSAPWSSPRACCKVFLTASPEARARRRFLELEAKGQSPVFEEILADQRRRDEADSTRAVAPLRPAEDAVTLDSSDLTLDQVVDWIVARHQAHP